LCHKIAWIRIRIRILKKGLDPDPDPYNKYTDPQHCPQPWFWIRKKTDPCPATFLSLPNFEGLCLSLYQALESRPEHTVIPSSVPKQANIVFPDDKVSSENISQSILLDLLSELKSEISLSDDKSSVVTGTLGSSAVMDDSISEERRLFRAAAVSAARRKCHIPLRKLGKPVLEAAAERGHLEVRNERLKLDLPFIRIRQDQRIGRPANVWYQVDRV